MQERVLDFSECAARLRVRDEQLVIEAGDAAPMSTPLAEAAVVVVAHPQVSVTSGVLAGLMKHGGALVACGADRMPCGMMLPIETHVVQTRRIAAQAGASEAKKKRLWQQVVRAKLRAQARLLERLGKGDGGLRAMAGKVRSGDAGNAESVGAMRYWPLVFGEVEFRRRVEAEDQNRLLNYGYAVLRGVVARAVCAAGLHPSLGLHHHNQYNAYCLADDLMEPWRPVVDGAVEGVVRSRGKDAELDREVKGELIGAILERRTWKGERRTLFDWAGRAANSLAEAYGGEGKKLEIAEL